MRPDVSPAVGWETGRGSEPAFLDMNRHALRGEGGSPTVHSHSYMHMYMHMHMYMYPLLPSYLSLIHI